nr:hypothetical protein [Fodinicola feengrottensis]
MTEQVQILAGHQFRTHHVVDRLRPGQGVCRQPGSEQHLVSPGKTEVAEQDRRAGAEAV